MPIFQDPSDNLELDLLAIEWGIIPPSITHSGQIQSLNITFSQMAPEDVKVFKRRFRKFKRKMMPYIRQIDIPPDAKPYKETLKYNLLLALFLKKNKCVCSFQKMCLNCYLSKRQGEINDSI
jgi:hypothetical protein